MAEKLKSFGPERAGGDRWPVAVPRRPIERDAVKHAGREPEVPVVSSLLQLASQAVKSCGVVKLVAVGAEDPCVRAAYRSTRSCDRAACEMRTASTWSNSRASALTISHVPSVDMWSATWMWSQNPSHVANHPLGEHVLVVEEHDGGDLHRRP